MCSFRGICFKPKLHVGEAFKNGYFWTHARLAQTRALLVHLLAIVNQTAQRFEPCAARGVRHSVAHFGALATRSRTVGENINGFAANLERQPLALVCKVCAFTWVVLEVAS